MGGCKRRKIMKMTRQIEPRGIPDKRRDPVNDQVLQHRHFESRRSAIPGVVLNDLQEFYSLRKCFAKNMETGGIYPLAYKYAKGWECPLGNTFIEIWGTVVAFEN